MKGRHGFAITLGGILALCTVAFPLSMAPPRPLAERIGEAETIFVGTLVNKVVDGDWVEADLIVDEPLKNAEKGKKIAVTWRLILVGGAQVAEPVPGSPGLARIKRVGQKPIFDVADGARGIAILKDKKDNRYWLRADKFEGLDKLDEIRELFTGPHDASQEGPDRGDRERAPPTTR